MENHDNGDVGQALWSSHNEQVLLWLLDKHYHIKSSGLPFGGGVAVPAVKLRQVSGSSERR